MDNIAIRLSTVCVVARQVTIHRTLIDCDVEYTSSDRTEPVHIRGDVEMSDATCFQGHRLEPRVSESPLWYCSMCGRGSSSRVSLHSCSKCYFDACPACVGLDVCRNGHPLSESVVGLHQGPVTACAECGVRVGAGHLSCDQCKYSLCDACAVALGMNEMRVGYAAQ